MNWLGALQLCYLTALAGGGRVIATAEYAKPGLAVGLLA